MTTTIERPIRSSVLRMATHPAVLLNAVAPLVGYQVLTRLGASELTALAVVTVFPLADVTRCALRERRIDGMAALTLATIAGGLLVGVLTADPYLLLVKESLNSAAVGVVFLGSLATSRPMVHRLAERFVDPQRLARRWEQSPGFRSTMRRITGVWGLALLAEAALRVAVSLLVTPGTLVAVSPLLMAAVIVPAVLWTRGRVRHARTLEER